MFKKGGAPKEVQEALAGDRSENATEAAQEKEIARKNSDSDDSEKMDGFEKSETTFTWQRRLLLCTRSCQ